MNLNDVFPDALTGSGIFDALNTYNVPWKTDISSISLDLEYFGNVSGDKTVSPLVRKLSVNGVLSSSAIAKIAQSLYNMHGLRWTKLWNTYQLEYDPIQNYNMTEIMSDDDTVTTYGRTHAKTGTEVDDRTRTDDNKESVYGFNSSTASDSDESDRTINDDNTHTYNVSDTDSGTDRQSHSYELTRSGNIGVTTSQQMIESERALWMWRYFYDVVFPDVDKMLTIAIYSCDEVISESGGATPTGTINITANGDYDVIEYARASVNVPNTYAESDNGMVVYNGELVSQIGREISENGTYDTTLNNAVMVNVSNTYTLADEGKVVDDGALVAQGSQTITENGTYDTTLISELVADISGVNILGGTDNPTSAIGSNGDIYIKYTDYSAVVPSGYTLVEYLGIGDTAGPYIDTGYDFTTTSEFELKAQYTNTPNSNSWLFGAYVSGKQTNVGYTSSTIWLQTGGSNVSKSFDTNVHVYQSTQTAFIIDGNTLTGSTPNWSNTTTLPAKLFYIGDGVYSNKCRIYYCKIWDEGTLARHLVPTKRNIDNVLGMYDLVNNVFYTNDGTGSFIAGEEFTGKPIDAAYLKVNGSWSILENCDWSDVII